MFQNLQYIRISYKDSMEIKERRSVGQKEAIQMKNITKRFGSTIANHNVDFEVREGEILSFRITSYNVCYTKLLRLRL